MITVNRLIRQEGGKGLVELYCKSTDTKPTGYLNGSTAIEVDTGNVYIFDEDSSVWNYMCSIKEA